MIDINLNQKKILCDGAFGTYYAMKYDTKDLPERANTEAPERVIEIHAEYLRAGADMIRTNTFACNSRYFPSKKEKESCLKKGYLLAEEAVERYRLAHPDAEQIVIAADIGKIDYEQLSLKEEIQAEYVEISEQFLALGAQVILFETFHTLEDILPAIDQIGDRACVIVQFALNQFGYSSAGLSARKLVEEAERCAFINAYGFNCGLGPGHMQKMIGRVSDLTTKPLTALPNAGYPKIIQNRMIFANDNIEYFADKMREIAEDGTHILGGCCGTTPEYIARMKQCVKTVQTVKKPIFSPVENTAAEKKQFAFYDEKIATGKKLIAVELAPPLGADDEKLMDAAHYLKQSGVDVLTFPDSPSGRTRADSVLMAEKVAAETGMCVMPHLCCRDKNAIAMRSQILGAYINQIHNFLVITGDPVPTMARASIKSVFNFDAVGLMKIMSDMNEEHFASGNICYGGAINQGRRNLDVEIERVKKKMAAGATFFLSQPVSTYAGAMRLKQVKEETGARILCGIMPFVSLKNAQFMKNEMTGIDVTEEVLSRYRADMTREEGEAAGVKLAKDMIALTEDFVDGYYFSFPFNRVYLLEKIWN